MRSICTRPAELGAVDLYSCSMIASFRDTGTAHLCLRRLATPAPRARRARHFFAADHQSIRRRVERGVHPGIAAACDAAVIIDGARLEAFGREPEGRTNRT